MAAAARLLLIDSDTAVRQRSAKVLTDAGYAVLQAGCGGDGLALFEQAPVDLVLLELVSSGTVAYAACAQLQAQAASRGVPIIVISDVHDAVQMARTYERGRTDFLTKPIAWELLPCRVDYALRTSRALQDMQRSRALLARSQQLAQMGSWEWDCASGVVLCSEEMQRIQGDTPAAPAPALPGLGQLLAGVHPDDSSTLQQLLAFAQTEGRPYELEMRIVRPCGTLRQVIEQTDVALDGAGRPVTVRGIRRDVTERVEADNRIRTLAYFDALTGLANRCLFQEMALQWLPYAQRRGLHCALLFIALDRFKMINETLGARAGDEVLKRVSERLRDGLRASDIKGMPRGQPAGREAGQAENENLLARLGGDEFTLLLVDVPDREGAAAVAQRLVRTLSQPMDVDGQELSITVSIGIALTPADGSEIDSLLRHASTAMHVAKESGRNQVRFYVEAMSAEIQRRLTLENDLHRALDQGEFSIHYQAKVDAGTSLITGAEALLRWQHPLRGAVSPDEFIPVAEESGLIVPITDWVITTVCRQLAAWRNAGVPVVPVSVNLDGKSMQNEQLPDVIRKAMADSGIGALELEFEVTESGLMRDLDRASQLLAQLKAMGLGLSIDDFGTGYSSLTYLKRFPVDVLKIDRSFIKDLLTDPNDAALTAAIIAMGLSLNLKLVAEGVETWAQADFLMQRGCHCVQGFLFSQPLRNESFAALLHAGLPLRALASAK